MEPQSPVATELRPECVIVPVSVPSSDAVIGRSLSEKPRSAGGGCGNRATGVAGGDGWGAAVAVARGASRVGTAFPVAAGVSSCVDFVGGGDFGPTARRATGLAYAPPPLPLERAARFSFTGFSLDAQLLFSVWRNQSEKTHDC